MKEHHDGLFGGGIGTVHPNIQIQAILALRIVGALLGLPLRLDRAFAEIIGFINAVVLRRGRGTLPSTAADRRLGVRDPPKGKDPLVLLSDERTVITLNRDKRIIDAVDLTVHTVSGSDPVAYRY